MTNLAALNPEYVASVELCRAMHRNPKYWRGSSVGAYAEDIAALVFRTRAATLLDYGAGKGWQYSRAWLHRRWGGVRPWCYDPGVPGFDVKPLGTFGGVICTDVLEHLPENLVTVVLAEIFGYAERFVLLGIATREATKVLPDGRNAHLTVRPETWWRERIAPLERDGLIVQAAFRGH